MLLKSIIRLLRALEKESGAVLRLCGYHGLAFDENLSVKHELVFVVSLLVLHKFIILMFMVERGDLNLNSDYN